MAPLIFKGDITQTAYVNKVVTYIGGGYYCYLGFHGKSVSGKFEKKPQKSVRPVGKKKVEELNEKMELSHFHKHLKVKCKIPIVHRLDTGVNRLKIQQIIRTRSAI